MCVDPRLHQEQQRASTKHVQVSYEDEIIFFDSGRGCVSVRLVQLLWSALDLDSAFDRGAIARTGPSGQLFPSDPELLKRAGR